MLTFTHRRLIRRSVIVTLAAWVFTLMAGVANACLPHERESSQDVQVQSVDADALEVGCNDSRDAGVAAVARQGDQDSSPSNLGAWPAGAAGPLLPVAAIKQADCDAVHAQGPPGAIRFLRLRL